MILLYTYMCISEISNGKRYKRPDGINIIQLMDWKLHFGVLRDVTSPTQNTYRYIPTYLYMYGQRLWYNKLCNNIYNIVLYHF